MKKPAIIMDNGTGYSKLGYAGQLEPSYIIHSCLASQNSTYVNKDLSDLNYSIGKEAIGNPNIIWPIKHGIVNDWSSMERYWEQCIFQYLRVDPTEHYTLLTEPPLNPPENRETTAEIMFETFGVKGLYIAVQAVLALAASWFYGSKESVSSTGTVIDIGDGVCHVIPVVEGYVIGSAVKNVPIAGRDITNYFSNMLCSREGLSMPMEKARQLKEQHCFLSRDIYNEIKSFNDTKALIIDKYCIGPERFIAPEILFTPQIISTKYNKGLPVLVDESIMSCPIDCRRSLYSNIVLSGGSTTIKNFNKRLSRDLREIVNERLGEGTMNININTHKSQEYAVFAGGSALASLDSFYEHAVEKKTYDEVGPSCCRCTPLFGFN